MSQAKEIAKRLQQHKIWLNKL